MQEPHILAHISSSLSTAVHPSLALGGPPADMDARRNELTLRLAGRAVRWGGIPGGWRGASLHNEAAAPDGPSKEETNGGVCRQAGTELTEGQHTHLSDGGGLNICTAQPRQRPSGDQSPTPEPKGPMKRHQQKHRRGRANQRPSAQGLNPLLL